MRAVQGYRVAPCPGTEHGPGKSPGVHRMIDSKPKGERPRVPLASQCQEASAEGPHRGETCGASAESPALRVALHCAMRFGWRVFPVRLGTKHPHIKGWPDRASKKPEVILKWAAMFPGCNWGLACGRGTGVIVVDEDLLEAADALGLPLCPICITGSGGRHFFLAWQPGIKRDTTKRKIPGCDILSDRSFVVLAGSVHKNGRPYVWLVSPDDVGLPPVPTELAERLMATTKAKGSRCGPRGRSRGSASESKSKGSAATTPDPRGLPLGSGRIPWHKRNDTLFRMGSSMRGRGASEDQILEELRIRYRNDCEKVIEDPLTDAELLGIVASVMKFPAGGGGSGLLSPVFVPDVPAELFQECRSPWIASIYEVLLARRDRRRLVDLSHKAVCDGLQYKGCRSMPSPRTITRCVTRLVKMGLAWRPSPTKLAQNTLNPRMKHYLLGVRHPDDPPPLSVTDSAGDAVGTSRTTLSPRRTLTTKNNTPGSKSATSPPLAFRLRFSNQARCAERATHPMPHAVVLVEMPVEDLLRELCPGGDQAEG